ncbi:MAG: hypothetical protein ABIP44_09795 [Pseudoxanthomonas sp.]
MNTQTLNTHSAVMPLRTHWDSRQLADAVPLRLSQLVDFSADTLRACDRVSANAAALRDTRRSTTFLPASAMTLFRTR